MRAWFLFLNYFFIALHFCIVVFTLFGWIPKKTRRLHLILIGLTAASWFGLGICFGLGFCFLTDWHWQVRRNLGYPQLPDSFVKFLIDGVTGFNVNADLVNTATWIGFLLALILSVGLNARAIIAKRSMAA